MQNLFTQAKSWKSPGVAGYAFSIRFQSMALTANGMGTSQLHKRI